MKNKVLIIVILFATISLLSGCTEINEPITKDSTGIWNELIVYPLSWAMTQIAIMFGGSQGYGISIILLTIFIRLAILPLVYKQKKSLTALQFIQPELEKLREKYDSSDAFSQQKLRQEQILLMQKYGINPMIGILLVLIQMPILLGFYHAIMRMEELKGNSFLWFDLTAPDPYFAMPIVTGVLTFVQQKAMTNTQMFQPQMVMMLWLMPLMVMIFSLYLPAALSLYWIAGNIFSIIQSYFIQPPEIVHMTTEPAVAGHTGGKKK